jgi:acetyl esterase/lipase
MSSPQLDALHALIRERPPHTATIAERRQAWEALAARFPVPADIAVEAVDANGVPGLFVSPPGVAQDRVLLFFHGGAFTLGSSRSYRELVGRMARTAGVRGLVIDYRLTPEHPFPAGLEDCIAAYEWLLGQGIAAKNIALAGDSAGGNLLVATLLALRDKGVALPACGVCISGWYDLTNGSESLRPAVSRDVFVPMKLIDTAPLAYLNGADASDPRASPLLGDLGGLPPLLIHVGEPELLVDDARRLADKVRAAGGTAELEIWPDMPHIWHFFGPMLDEGRAATDQAGRFIKSHVGR